MAENVQPLTEEERAELEALRAEKAARLEREQAERERAELEALRAEKAGAQEAAPKQAAQPVQRQAAAARTSQQAAAEAERDRQIREARERGEKLMMPDDDLKMPVGQKLVLLGIAVIVLLIVIMNLVVH